MILSQKWFHHFCSPNRFPICHMRDMNRIACKYTLLSIVLVLMMLFIGQIGAASETSEGSVECINNSNIPSEGIKVISLEEDWRIVKTNDNDPVPERIDDIEISRDGNIYMLDVKNGIFVFSPEGDYLRTVTITDNQHGHLIDVRNMLALPSGGMGLLNRWPWIVKISVDGVVSKGITYKRMDSGCGNSANELFDGKYVEGSLVLAGMSWSLGKEEFHESNRQIHRTAISKYSPEGNEVIRYYSTEKEYNFTTLELDEDEEYHPVPGAWALGRDGRVYLAPYRNKYEIHVLNADGEIDKIIKRDIAIPKRNTEKNALLQSACEKRLQRYKGWSYELSHTDQVVKNIRIEDDGTIWILHARSDYKQPEGILVTYDVFNPSGEFIYQAAIACEGNSEKDALYWVNEGTVLKVTNGQIPYIVIPGGSGVLRYGGDPLPIQIDSYVVLN